MVNWMLLSESHLLLEFSLAQSDQIPNRVSAGLRLAMGRTFAARPKLLATLEEELKKFAMQCIGVSILHTSMLCFSPLLQDEKTIDAIKLHQSSQPTSMHPLPMGSPDQSEMSVSDDDEMNSGARSSESARHSQFDDNEFDIIASRMKLGNSSNPKGSTSSAHNHQWTS